MGTTLGVLQILINSLTFGEVIDVECQLVAMLNKVSLVCMEFAIFIGISSRVLGFNI